MEREDDSSASDLSSDSFCFSKHNLKTVNVTRGQVRVEYPFAIKELKSLDELRHNRLSYPIESETDKRACEAAITRFTDALANCSIGLQGENGCIWKLLAPHRPPSYAAIIDSGEGGLFRISNETTFRGSFNPMRQTVLGNVRDVHVQTYPYRGGDRKIVLQPGIHWIRGIICPKNVNNKEHGRLIAIFVSSYGWIFGELNTTAYFDSQDMLLYTGPTLSCMKCLARSKITSRIRCRMCLPHDPRIEYGISLGKFEGMHFVVRGDKGKCRIFSHDSSKTSTFLRRASRAVGPGVSVRHLRRAISISGLKDSPERRNAAISVYPVATLVHSFLKAGGKSFAKGIIEIEIVMDDWGRILHNTLVIRSERVYVISNVLVHVSTSLRSHLWNKKFGILTMEYFAQ